MARSGPLRIAVLLTGGGRTYQYLHDAVVAGQLPAAIVLVVSSRPDARGLERAKANRCPAVTVQRRGRLQEDFDRAIAEAVTAAGVDLVCMGGFLSFWGFPAEFESRVMNIHPALLPEFGGKGFYGRRVHEAVLAAGRTVSGCTVHFADQQYDHGPIILQGRVSVRPDDTADSLARRVFRAEMKAYPEAIRLFAEDRLRVIAGRVEIVPAPGASTDD